MLDLKNNREYNLALSLINRNQYLDAQDRFSVLLTYSKDYLPDILIPLYKRLTFYYNNLQLRILIAELYIICEQYQEAILELQEAYEIDSSFTQTYFLLGKIYRRTGNYDHIKEIFEQAFDENIMDSAILDYLPKMYLEEDNLQKSIEFYKEILKRFPDKMHYYYTLAELYERMFKNEEAGFIYKAIAEKTPNDINSIIPKCKALITKSPRKISIRNLLIKLHLKTCQPTKIITEINEMVEMQLLEILDAIKIYKKALEMYPSTNDIIFALSEKLIDLERYSEAVGYLREIVTADNIAVMYIPTSTILQKIIEKYPSQLLAQNLLADVHYFNKEYSISLDYIDKILNSGTPNIDVEQVLKMIIVNAPELQTYARYLLSKYHFLNEEFRYCIEESKWLINTDYKFKANLLLSNAEYMIGNIETSQQILNDLFVEHPHTWEVHKNSSDLYEKIIEERVVNENNHHNNIQWLHYETAIKHLKKRDIYPALENFQKISTNEDLQIQAHIMIGRCFLEMGRFDLSINQLTRIMDHKKNIDSTLANKLRYLISINLINSGKVSEAVSYLESILEQNVNFPNIRSILDHCKNWRFFDFRGKVLGGCLLSDDNFYIMTIPNMEGHDLIEKPQELQNISFAYPHNNQGVDYILKNHLQAAEDEFSLAIKLDSGLTALYCNLAILNIIKGDYDLAIINLDDAEKINPDFDVIWLNRGLISIKRNNLDAALGFLQKALKINPDNYLARFNIGEVYYRKEEIKAAFDNWKHLINVGNLFYLVHRRIEYLTPKKNEFSDWLDDVYMLDLENIVTPTKKEDQGVFQMSLLS
jgi:tetratricopeptide (TPR) repeat protein